MQTPEFERHLEKLIQLAKQERIAIMCAEAVPLKPRFIGKIQCPRLGQIGSLAFRLSGISPADEFRSFA